LLPIRGLPDIDGETRPATPEGIAKAKSAGVYNGRPASIDAVQVRATKARGKGASKESASVRFLPWAHFVARTPHPGNGAISKGHRPSVRSCGPIDWRGSDDLGTALRAGLSIIGWFTCGIVAKPR
jgi:hypothetical protein